MKKSTPIFRIASRATRGFSLVEVAMALAVAAFCLLTLVALLPVGLRSYQRADNQTIMVNLATMVARDLEATPQQPVPPATSPQSPRFLFTIPAAGNGTPQTLYADVSGVPLGTASDPITPGSIYRVNVTVYSPAAGQKLATTAHIQITSPAQAALANYTDIFQTVVALNRN
jgi:uncharacterized protein (TIGR02598 family)